MPKASSLEAAKSPSAPRLEKMCSPKPRMAGASSAPALSPQRMSRGPMSHPLFSEMRDYVAKAGVDSIVADAYELLVKEKPRRRKPTN